jgi:hypothetical protein
MAETSEAQAGALTAQDLASIRWAHARLEHPSFAARLSNFIGSPIEGAMGLLPAGAQLHIRRAAESAIRRALDVALVSTGDDVSPVRGQLAHRLLATASGAVGGWFGPLALAAELPVVTILMLRSIAEIARAEGEDLATLESRLACVEVFALGGRSHEDDAAETGYFGLRAAIALHFFGGIEAAVGQAESIPLGVGLIRGIAARFGVVVSDKAAVQLVPVVGAASGALVNYVFMKHFQDVARGHFTLRRLERHYGKERVREAYERAGAEAQASAREFSPLEGW